VTFGVPCVHRMHHIRQVWTHHKGQSHYVMSYLFDLFSFGKCKGTYKGEMVDVELGTYNVTCTMPTHSKVLMTVGTLKHSWGFQQFRGFLWIWRVFWYLIFPIVLENLLKCSLVSNYLGFFHQVRVREDKYGLVSNLIIFKGPNWVSHFFYMFQKSLYKPFFGCGWRCS